MYQTLENTNLSMRLDGNNVDIDTEMDALAKNTIQTMCWHKWQATVS